MKMSNVADLQGKECVLIESGRGRIVRCLRFYEDEVRLYADFEITHSHVFTMNRVCLNGEPAIANWEVDFKRVGEVFGIFQPKNQIFRSPRLYLHFSSPFGGTRLFFIDQYIDKVRCQNSENWEWDDLMQAAQEGNEGHHRIWGTINVNGS